MNQNQTPGNNTPLPPSSSRHFYQWVVAFAPPVIITLAALTLFRDVIIRSIASSAHPVLVYVILVAFFTGLVFCAFALYRYQREARYIQRWQNLHLEGGAETSILATDYNVSSSIALTSLKLNLAESERQSRFELEVDSVRAALGEKLAYANFIAGALIGLGLVGTFVGLLGTLEDLGAVFGSLAQTGNSDMNPTAVFSNMVNRLQEPMKGMGTAFVSSLYGLLGSLVVGLCALSVSKAGSTVIKDLHAAGRLHALQHDAPAITKESAAEQTQKIYHLQTLLEKLLRSQVETENRVHTWLENGETRLAKMLAQTLEANWTASSEMVAKHQQVIDQLSAILGAHDDNAQILATRITEQDQHLTLSMRDLADRNTTDQTILREEVLGAVERTHADRNQQIEAIFKAIQNVSTLTERSTSVLFDHLQKQAKTFSHAVRISVAKKSIWPFRGAAREEEQTHGLIQMAQSIERQTRLLEELIRSNQVRSTNDDPSLHD